MAYTLILNTENEYNKSHYETNHIMKTFFDSKKLRSLSLLVAFVLVAIALTSCMKDGGNNNLPAFVQVANSSEASVPQDFYLDSTRLTTSAVAYGSSSTFLKTAPGNYQARFKNSGTSVVNVTFSLVLTAGKSYSIFYTDGNSYTSFEDERSTPQSGKARVRFINLSSALSSNVDFAAAGGAKLVSNLAYKTASAYTDVDPATSFSLYINGSSSALISIPASLQAGHTYSIYISGATSATVTYHVVTEY
jgi:hypothetical protein